MSLAYQDQASPPCHLFMNNWSDWNDLHSLSDLGQRVRSRTHRHVLKHWGKEVQRILFSSPPHQLYLISDQTEASKVKGSYLHWLSLGGLLPSALACTAETTPIQQVQSAFCVCVCSSENVGVKEWNTFPEATIKSHREDNELLSSGRLVRTGEASRHNQSTTGLRVLAFLESFKSDYLTQRSFTQFSFKILASQ